jgi:hypothetical protein
MHYVQRSMYSGVCTDILCTVEYALCTAEYAAYTHLLYCTPCTVLTSYLQGHLPKGAVLRALKAFLPIDPVRLDQVCVCSLYSM